MLALLATLDSSGQAGKMDLVIKNATLFDSRTGALSANQTIVIKDGTITRVSSSKKNYTAMKTIDARGKLVTPGFIDTHFISLTFIDPMGHYLNPLQRTLWNCIASGFRTLISPTV